MTNPTSDADLVSQVMASTGYIEAKNMRQFEALTELSARIHSQLREVPRCVNCDHNIMGWCDQFKADIPEEHKAEATNCEHWEANLPF